MLSLFMEWGADRLKAHRQHLNHEGLYKLATGKELIEGAPAGVTLQLLRVAVGHGFGALVWQCEYRLSIGDDLEKLACGLRRALPFVAQRFRDIR